MSARQHELVRELSTWTEEGPPVLDACVEPIRRALDADECVACEWESRAGAAVVQKATSAAAARAAVRLRATGTGGECALSGCASCPLAAGGPGVLAREEVEQRLSPRARGELASSLALAGLSRGDALRAVMAPEGSPVACVAALRASGRFGASERTLLAAIATPLGTRCSVERRLADARFASAAMAAALELLARPAFVLQPWGGVVHANRMGRELLDADPAGAREILAAAARGRSPVGASVTCLEARGAPGHLLLALPPARADAEARTRALATEWKLTPRQAEVLARIARGGTNREIASALAVSESTVEAHVTALLSKAGAESRSRLIARYWDA